MKRRTNQKAIVMALILSAIANWLASRHAEHEASARRIEMSSSDVIPLLQPIRGVHEEPLPGMVASAQR